MGHEFKSHLWLPPHAVANLPPAACLHVLFALEMTWLQIFICFFIIITLIYREKWSSDLNWKFKFVLPLSCQRQYDV